jgi:hypothetical protein
MKAGTVLLLVSLAGLCGLPGRAADGPAEALKAALEKTRTAGSYFFTLAESGAGPASQVEAKYQKGQPLFCRAEGLDCYKQGEEIVYKQGDQWLRSKRGTLSDPLRVLGAIAKVRSVILPHEDLAGLERSFKEIKEAREDKLTVYSGELTEEAAKKLGRPNFREIARGGTARVWVDGGNVAKYTITIHVRGRLGNAEVDGMPTRTVTLTGLNGTKVEIPDSAKKALE